MNRILSFIFIALLILSSACRHETSEVKSRNPEKRDRIRRPAMTEAQKKTLQVDMYPVGSLDSPVFDRERLWSMDTDWEPALAADRGGPYVYQATTRYESASPVKIIFRRSIDGGETWEADRLLHQDLTGGHADPQLEVSGDGTVYAAWMQGWVVTVKRSTDHGLTWTPGVSVLKEGVPPNYSDKPILVVSGDGQDVYVGFNWGHAYVVSSHDAGDTFSDPLKTSNDSRTWFHSGGVVAPNGDVYFAAADYKSDFTGPVNISVVKSTDGGDSWTTTLIDTSEEVPDHPGGYFGFIGPQIAIAMDPAGRLMIAYNLGNATGESQRMYIQTSFDGIIWSPRQEISNGSVSANNAFPALTAGLEAGHFRVAWQDERNGAGFWNTWYRSTRNGGKTWSAARRLSDRPDGAFYKHPEGYDFPYGDYLEMAVDGRGVTHLIWGAGESYWDAGGCWYTKESTRFGVDPGRP